MGGIYTSDEYYDYDELYCEECGDSDTYLGCYETFREFAERNIDLFDYKGSGGYDLNQVFKDDGSTTIKELKELYVRIIRIRAMIKISLIKISLMISFLI